MNRENKRRKYDKGYFRKHPCPDPFTCRVCGRLVVPGGAGSDHRNHCPNCLSSVHVDERPGNRASACHGVMEPVAVWVRKDASMPFGESASINSCNASSAFPLGNAGISPAAPI